MHFDPFLTVAVIKFMALCGLIGSLFGRRRIVAFGFLIPLAAMAVSALLKKKAGDKAKKADEANQKAQFDREQEDKRAAWEERYSSPSAESQRLRATYQLGRLLAATGGRDKGPKSLISRYETMRTKPVYGGGSTYTAPQSGGGGWNFAADLVGAAGSAAGNYAAGRAASQAAKAAADQQWADKENFDYH